MRSIDSPSDTEVVTIDDGARLWTATHGAGRPVVWCHGGPGGTDALGPDAEMIDDVARVHRYEQRACGRSGGRPPFTMDRSIADLDALRSHWGHERWIVAGHSFGASLALAYALRHPARTDALVLVSCAIRLNGQPDWQERYQATRLERLPEAPRRRFLEIRELREQGDEDPLLLAEMRRLSGPTDFGDRAVAERVAGRYEAELARVNNEVNRELGADSRRWFEEPGLREAVRALDVPVLLVHGDADPRPMAAVAALAAELPRARLVRLPGVGHFPWWEAPDILRDVLRGFIVSLP